MTAYYNEIDPFAAQWLRELIDEDLIANGDVDERSIEDVKPSDLTGYKQCHFFAGIGVWSYALRQAGWPDDRQVWTGSCPCQPFSSAGKRKGFIDERHLWPAWLHLIEQCNPRTIFGEQVASKDGLAWLDAVQADLEAKDYTSAAVDLCAAGVGAPHIRQRLWFVAYSDGMRFERKRGERKKRASEHSEIRSMANPKRKRLSKLEQQIRSLPKTNITGASNGRGISGSKFSNVADPDSIVGRLPVQQEQRKNSKTIRDCEASGTGKPYPVNGFWESADWIGCRDGKFRAVESGTFPLVNGATARVGRLRGYGNAINAEVAKAFIEACK